MSKNWKKVALGDVCQEISYGYTESASVKKIGPKFLRITDIQNDFINWDDVPYCRISEKKFKKYKLEIGDVLIARTGNSTGATAIVKDEIEAVYASYLIKYSLNLKKAYPYFIDFVLRSQTWKNYVDAIKGGSAQPGANAKQFAAFEFNLPSLQEQKAIASILSALDDKIENNLQMNKTLEEMAMALYKYWFVDFGPFQDGEFIDTELGEIPKGWEVKKLQEISINHNKKRKPISTRERAKRPGRFPYYGATKILDFIDDYKFEGQFILLAEDGTVKTERDTPFLQFVEGKFWVSNHAHVLTGNDQYSNEFLYLSLNNKNVIPIITGAVQLKINKGNLESLQFVTASKDILKSFEELIIPLFRKQKTIYKENITLKKLRDTILPELISGEVRVKDLEKTLSEVL